MPESHSAIVARVTPIRVRVENPEHSGPACNSTGRRTAISCAALVGKHVPLDLSQDFARVAVHRGGGEGECAVTCSGFAKRALPPPPPLVEEVLRLHDPRQIKLAQLRDGGELQHWIPQLERFSQLCQ